MIKKPILFIYFRLKVTVWFMKKFLYLILLIFTSIFISNAAFANVIRDSEIESVIEDIISPLRDGSGMSDLKITIIDDPQPNAFTAGGNVIYITSGMIVDYPNPDVIRGVIAHEIGHIQGQHIIRRQEVIDNYSKASLIATALGLATAISGGAAEGLAISLGGVHIVERSVLAYSRGYESAADQYALKILEKSGHSAIGLIKFFEKQRIQSAQMFGNPYDQTHPMSKDRLLIIYSFNKRSKYPKSQNSEILNYRTRRAAAKLAAYTFELDKILDCSFEEDLDELTHYMKAIKCYRIGNFDDALNHINRILLKRPKDPFYHELKGQIYFEAGKNMSLHEYDMAIEQRPNDVLLRLGRAVIGITKYRADHYGMNNYYKDLQFVTEKEPKNLLALFYLAIYYDSKNMVGKNYLTTAQISYYTGNIANARRMAKAALAELSNKSPDWYKAQDILEMTKLDGVAN